MLNINVITVGKLKESYLRDACAEYEKRLGAYSTIKVIELAESRLPDSPSQKEIANALENEADMILKKITPQSAVIAMCIEGKMMSSEDFSHKLEGFALEGKSTVNLIIGSSYGLSDRGDICLSVMRSPFPVIPSTNISNLQFTEKCKSSANRRSFVYSYL